MKLEKNKKINKKSIVVAVSGGFDPIHIGHARLFEAAKKLGDKLVVILNNDNWLKNKKGFVFMPQEERKELIESLGPVDKVILTAHPELPKDITVCKELMELHPDIFANGGDRIQDNTPETMVCQGINCRMVFGVGTGGKIQSSSWLLTKYAEKLQGKDHRPWGYFVVIEKGKNYKVKRVVVNPGQKLSLQFHRKRSEHWVVLNGKARVELNNKIFNLEPRQSIDIPIKAEHRLENPGSKPLEIIEVQNGNYLEEDDIVRIKDKYGRNDYGRKDLK